MSDKLEQTRKILATHHRDGEWFAQLMRETFSERFDQRFWQVWQQWMEPVMGERPQLLDLGTGPGLFLKEIERRYPKSRAVGVECAEYMLAAADGCEIVVADLHAPALPYADGEVDVVAASVVLHELSQPVRLLQEVQRCLKQGGRLSILDWVRVPLQQYLANEESSVFGPETSVDELQDTFIHFIEHNRFSVGDLLFLLHQCGFKVLHQETLKNAQFVHLIAEKV